MLIKKKKKKNINGREARVFIICALRLGYQVIEKQKIKFSLKKKENARRIRAPVVVFPQRRTLGRLCRSRARFCARRPIKRLRDDDDGSTKGAGTALFFCFFCFFFLFFTFRNERSFHTLKRREKTAR